jgi:PD-(D/E)XK endonuclease
MFPGMRSRMINRRQQGDLGEASAIEWLTRQGATVLIPFGHSPDYDLVAEIRGELLRVQVKTSTQSSRSPSGDSRSSVMVATNGGNQSWTGTVKRLDPSQFDFLFVLTGDGRRWFIPAREIDARRSLTLGGAKYSEYEIERGPAIERIVYGSGEEPSRIADAGGAPESGEPGWTVNSVPQLLSGFESHLPHSQASPLAAPRFRPSRYERRLGKNGIAVINQKRRVTLPQGALLAAGLRDGDHVRATADGSGRIVLEKTGLPVWAEPT